MKLLSLIPPANEKADKQTMRGASKGESEAEKLSRKNNNFSLSPNNKREGRMRKKC